MAFSAKVQEAFDLWMDIPLDEQYYAFLDAQDKRPSTPWKDMDDEEAEYVIELLTRYKDEHATN